MGVTLLSCHHSNYSSRNANICTVVRRERELKIRLRTDTRIYCHVSHHPSCVMSCDVM